MSERPTHLDLFSGIGGFSLAFESEGFRTIGFSEIDPYASAVLKKHWPDVPNYGDVRAVNSELVGVADVLTAGVPCQPASTAGKRGGSSDERWLWPEALRILGDIRPRFAVFENPPGLFSVERGRAFNRIIGSISALRYSVWWEVVPACAVGANHPRDRVIIVANTNEFRCTGRNSSNREGTHWNETCSKTDSGDTCHKERFNTQKESERHDQQHGAYSNRISNAPDNDRRLRAQQGKNGRMGREPQQTETKGNLWIGNQWSIEPDVVRVVHGVSTKLDHAEAVRVSRLRCLGNSVVPQVAQIFARAIKAAIEIKV